MQQGVSAVGAGGSGRAGGQGRLLADKKYLPEEC